MIDDRIKHFNAMKEKFPNLIVYNDISKSYDGSYFITTKTKFGNLDFFKCCYRNASTFLTLEISKNYYPLFKEIFDLNPVDYGFQFVNSFFEKLNQNSVFSEFFQSAGDMKNHEYYKATSYEVVKMNIYKSLQNVPFRFSTLTDKYFFYSLPEMISNYVFDKNGNIKRLPIIRFKKHDVLVCFDVYSKKVFLCNSEFMKSDYRYFEDLPMRELDDDFIHYFMNQLITAELKSRFDDDQITNIPYQNIKEKLTLTSMFF